MKYLIAGLGNPGSDYVNTRHNIGFKVLDALAGASNTFFSPDRYADRAEVKHRGRTLVLIKPTTFMNLSGKAVRYWMEKEKIPADRILVVTDDLAIDFGRIRMRGKGSDGGHNGLKSIQSLIQTTQYPRLRFGVGNQFAKGRQVDYVLGEWTEEENKTLKERIELASQAITSFASIGIDRTMSEFNGK
ncbi:aminoacyl-tRNA hydrolase [bacterium SCSIO 12741]|nr:aminoacyl-tRNA hydrolase [bacterium SCSIO 12741]